MDHAFEAEGKTAPPPTAKPRAEVLQVFQGLPKEFLRHRGVALAVGVGKRIAFGRCSATNARQRARVQRQCIAHIVESEAMGQLREEQAEHVTPGGVGAGVVLYAGLSGQLWHEMIGNEVANLAQDRELTLRWLLLFGFVFHDRALWHGARQKPTRSEERRV